MEREFRNFRTTSSYKTYIIVVRSVIRQQKKYFALVIMTFSFFFFADLINFWRYILKKNVLRKNRDKLRIMLKQKMLQTLCFIIFAKHFRLFVLSGLSLSTQSLSSSLTCGRKIANMGIYFHVSICHYRYIGILPCHPKVKP